MVLRSLSASGTHFLHSRGSSSSLSNIVTVGPNEGQCSEPVFRASDFGIYG